MDCTFTAVGDGYELAFERTLQRRRTKEWLAEREEFEE